MKRTCFSISFLWDVIVSRTCHGHGRESIKSSDRGGSSKLDLPTEDYNVKMAFDMCGREVVATFQASRSSRVSPLLLDEFVVSLKISPNSFSFQKLFCGESSLLFSSLFFTILL